MKKSTLGSALAIAMLFSTAMAADLHALTAMQTVPVPTPSTEDKTTCDTIVTGNGKGFTMCAFLSSGASRETTSYTIATERPVTSARFFQVVN
jgi:hypothetical protein